MLALCKAEYYYGFIFNSPITKFFNLPSPAQQILDAEKKRPFDIISLSKTSQAVLYFMMQLFLTLFFTLYFDNLFSKANLFHVFRYYKISTRKTARSESKL